MLQDLGAVIRGGSVVRSRHQGQNEGEEAGGFLVPPKSTVCPGGGGGRPQVNSQSEGMMELYLPFLVARI